MFIPNSLIFRRRGALANDLVVTVGLSDTGFCVSLSVREDRSELLLWAVAVRVLLLYVLGVLYP